jgi:hypothetical protein
MYWLCNHEAHWDEDSLTQFSSAKDGLYATTFPGDAVNKCNV